MTHQTNDYGIVYTKLPREVVLLNTVGGCSWARCAFCDYCNTYGRTTAEAAKHNEEVLAKVQGHYKTLQVICSANFIELPVPTLYSLRTICEHKGITRLIVETHWMHRMHDARIRDFFKGITIDFVYGVESFNFLLREATWFKGYGDVTPAQIASYADSINLLIGVKGQTWDDISNDIDIALSLTDSASVPFSRLRRIYIYVFETNETEVERDNELIEEFYLSELFKELCCRDNVEILDGMDSRAPDNLGYVGVGAQY